MAKTQKIYVCQNCGTKYSKWLGQCSACKQWNSIVEEIVEKKGSLSKQISASEFSSRITPLSEIQSNNEQRINTQNKEFNRVLGGGIIPGSMVLIGGDPGIGKSTLLLQIAMNIPKNKILYISGEESLQQIKLRADRLHSSNTDCYVLCDTSLENILLSVKKFSPEIVVIDSIQTLHTEQLESSPGSVGQIRECTNMLMQYAKNHAVAFFLIGHINKEGSLAGPKVLEHMVDTVLQFEGDTNHLYRILRSAKNRFGSTSELGIFEMQHTGLREVTNPSELLITQNDEEQTGTTIACTIEGARPFLIEIQSLVSSAVYGTPQRSTTGFDIRRLNMLLAVLEKQAGFRLGTKDVFLNLAGGFKTNDPAADLAIIIAILSSDLDMAIPKDYCFTGEISLSGQIRPVNRILQRISEAQKLGFKKIIVSSFNQKIIQSEKKSQTIKIEYASNVGEVVRNIFTSN